MTILGSRKELTFQIWRLAITYGKLFLSIFAINGPADNYKRKK